MRKSSVSTCIQQMREDISQNMTVYKLNQYVPAQRISAHSRTLVTRNAKSYIIWVHSLLDTFAAAR